MRDPARRYWAVRLLIAAIMVIGLPTVLSVPAFLAEAPIRVDEDSPRTVFAPSLIRVDDPAATERARQDAAEDITPIVRTDPEAQAAAVNQVRDHFERVAEVRQPGEPDADDEDAEEPEAPTVAEQKEALEGRLTVLDDTGLDLLVNMSDARLDRVASESVSIAQELARQRVREEDLDRFLDDELPSQLAIRDISPEVAEHVVDPIIRAAMRPTVTVDEEATAAARAEAAASVSEVVRSFPAGAIIIQAGEEATAVQVAALERAGLVGADPRWEVLRALGLVGVALLLVAVYLRVAQPRTWGSNRDLLLLATLALGYAILLGSVAAAGDRSDIWLLAVPAGALAMLTTILLRPAVGVLIVIPIALLTAFVAPDAPGVIAFATSAALLSVPLASRLSARGQLRRATLVATVAYIALAAIFTAVFAGIEDVPAAILAGAIHGIGSAVIVLGVLPFIETGFGIVTPTSLIDLADRNHPLLRDLEQKAIGSYNHSIVVATIVERACRAIEADSLLGSVCALYHDIGKVQRPYFFVENQFGISNPHDELEPVVSARIIHRHVHDGIEMATTYSLPAEVVDGIATHHGTTLVTYFYLEAVRRARPGEEVQEEQYRYPGRKPRTKETAVLMLADCCEAASRAAAQNDRNLTREQLVELVEALIHDRVDDGQLDESPLTFKDLSVVRGSFIDTLVGVYHPRITYPEDRRGQRDGDGAPSSHQVPVDADLSVPLTATGDGHRSARDAPDAETATAPR